MTVSFIGGENRRTRREPVASLDGPLDLLYVMLMVEGGSCSPGLKYLHCIFFFKFNKLWQTCGYYKCFITVNSSLAPIILWKFVRFVQTLFRIPVDLTFNLCCFYHSECYSEYCIIQILFLKIFWKYCYFHISFFAKWRQLRLYRNYFNVIMHNINCHNSEIYYTYWFV